MSSDRQPVLFLGHGSPMNVIQDSAFRRAWVSLGDQFGKRWPKPDKILCISAHWITEGWWLTGMAQPPTIHDFGGFPDELFAQQYPAPGAPQWAAELAQRLHQPHNGAPIGIEMKAWGLDHGCWGVLKPMFAAADIPVVQLSVDYHRPPEQHYALGQQLQVLRDEGVLIVASGNTVHNLRALRRDAPEGQTYDWAQRFDDWVAAQIQDAQGQDAQGQDAQGQNHQRENLTRFRELGSVAQMAHPSWDHFLPLLYAAGAARDDDQVSFFNDSHQLASIAMRSVIWESV